MNKWLTEAVVNNAAWCDAIASSHGISTEYSEQLWVCEQPMPLLYPNIITLKNGVSVNKKIESISPMLPPSWGIKDSFSELDLNSKGFSPVIDAYWYCLVPSHNSSNSKGLHRQVKSVSSQTDLDRWVAAWGESQDIFNIELVKDDCIELLYVKSDNKIVAGLATNVSGQSVGITNTFGPLNELLNCVNSVITKHPDKGIVGYGTEAEIAMLSKIGFQAIGNLRVWMSQ